MGIPIPGKDDIFIETEPRARFLSLARSKLRLCSANRRAGYFSNLACDWLSIVWAYSEHETENGLRWSMCVNLKVCGLHTAEVWEIPIDFSFLFCGSITHYKISKRKTELVTLWDYVGWKWQIPERENKTFWGGFCESPVDKNCSYGMHFYSDAVSLSGKNRESLSISST